MEPIKTKLSILSQVAIYLVLIAVMTSCDDSDDMGNKAHFSPPLWIIGSWQSDISASEWNLYHLYRVYEFTEDNVIGKSSLEPNVSSTNFNQSINTSEWGLKGIENISNNEYEVILIFGGIQHSHRFEKVNDTTLIYHYLYDKKDPAEQETSYALYRVE